MVARIKREAKHPKQKIQNFAAVATAYERTRNQVGANDPLFVYKGLGTRCMILRVRIPVERLGRLNCYLFSGDNFRFNVMTVASIAYVTVYRVCHKKAPNLLEGTPE
jgi:hypothetical protein